HKILIIQAEAVGCIQLHARKFVANFNMPIHEFLASFEGEEIPIAGLHEGIDEKEFALSGDEMGAAFGGVEGIDLVDVHAALGHGDKGPWCAQIAAEAGFVDGGGLRL